MARRFDTQIIKFFLQQDVKLQQQNDVIYIQDTLSKWSSLSVDPYVARRARLASYDIQNIEKVAILAITIVSSPHKEQYSYNLLSARWDIFAKLLGFGFKTEHIWIAFKDFFNNQWKGPSHNSITRADFNYGDYSGDKVLISSYQWCKEIVNFFQCDAHLLDLYYKHISDEIQYVSCDAIRHCYDFFTVKLLYWVVSHNEDHEHINESWALCLRAWRGTFYIYNDLHNLHVQAQLFEKQICTPVLQHGDVTVVDKLMNGHVMNVHKNQLIKQYAYQYLKWLYTGEQSSVPDVKLDTLNCVSAGMLLDVARIHYHIAGDQGYLFFNLIFGLTAKKPENDNGTGVWYKVLGSTIDYLIQNCNKTYNTPIFLFKININDVYWMHPIYDVQLFIFLCTGLSFDHIKTHFFIPLTMHTIRNYNVNFNCLVNNEKMVCETKLPSTKYYKQYIVDFVAFSSLDGHGEKFWIKRIWDSDTNTGSFHQVILPNNSCCNHIVSFFAKIAILDIIHSTAGLSEITVRSCLSHIYNPSLQWFCDLEKSIDCANILEDGLLQYLKGLCPNADVTFSSALKLDRFYSLYQAYIKYDVASLFYAALRAVTFHSLALSDYKCVVKAVENMYIPSEILHNQILSLLYAKNKVSHTVSSVTVVKRTITKIKQALNILLTKNSDIQSSWYQIVQHIETIVLPRAFYVKPNDIVDVSYSVVVFVMKAQDFNLLLSE